MEDQGVTIADVLPRTTHGTCLGATRGRGEEENDINHKAKKILMYVPTLEDCLGKEYIQRLREMETPGFQNKHNVTVTRNVVNDTDQNLEVVAYNREELHARRVSATVIRQKESSDHATHIMRESGSELERVAADETENGDKKNNTMTYPDTEGTDPGTEEGA